MKNALLLFLLPLLSFAATAQSSELILSFEPSFLSKSRLIISNLNKKATIKLQVQNDSSQRYEEVQQALSREDLNHIVHFMNNYQFKTKSSVDTIGTVEATRNGRKVTGHRISVGLDGIFVKGEFYDGQANKYFSFWSPKAGTENHDLVKQVLGLIDKYFKEKLTQQYLADLRHYL